MQTVHPCAKRLRPLRIQGTRTFSTLLWRPTRFPLISRVSSDQGNSRTQSCAAAPRGGGGCAVPCLRACPCWTRVASKTSAPREVVCPVKPAFAVGVTRGREARTSRRADPKPHQTLCIRLYPARFPWESAPERPRFGHERASSGLPGRRRSISESSCGTPMHAPSLTKGYGGNPPSGRSVSPPRTGPFFCP